MPKMNWAYRQRAMYSKGIKAILVEKESSFRVMQVNCLNPVRAGFVQFPGMAVSTILHDWKSQKPKFLSIEWILYQFHEEQSVPKSYEDLYSLDLEKEAPWKDLRGGFILGKTNLLKKSSNTSIRKNYREVPHVERFVARRN
jgi:hypothetical protein